jgi:transcriptional regulator with XRE-family HTH domain
MMRDVDAGRFVLGLRERHGLTQAQLAYRAGTSRQAVSRIEQGVVSPTVGMLARLAACCGEELVLQARPRAVPFEDSQLSARRERPLGERAELSFSWNKLAGELTAAGARARGER